MLVSNTLYNGKHIPDPTAKAALDNIDRQHRKALRDKRQIVYEGTDFCDNGCVCGYCDDYRVVKSLHGRE